MFWDFDKKNECNNIIKNWQMTFQASDFKGRQFLNLLDNKLLSIEPLYINGCLWIKHFRHSNSLCTRVMRAITNHTPIGKYHLCFFSNKDFSYPYRIYLIESRCNILHDWRRFNNCWNLIRDTISQFVLFFKFNLNIFSFEEGII